jgi:tripartite-type tricarboxylate transporter receptor subunit TctC
MIHLSRRTMLGAGLVAVAAPMIAGVRGARAQDAYPSRVIKLVVPWPPGGVTDVTGRLIAQKLSTELGQSVIVENRQGASGTIGHAAVAQSAPDGYTLLLGTNSTYAIAPHLFERLPYDTDKALAPISLVARGPQVWCAHPSMPFKDFKGFLEYVRARQPDGVTFGTAGPGASSHLATELMMSMAGFRMLHVPYRGGGPSLQALLAGEVNVVFVDAVIALPFVGTDKLRMLAVSGAERIPALPDVPTVAEAGIAGFQSSTDLSLFAPAGTPDAIVRALHVALVAALKSPEVREPMLKQGSTIVGGTPEEFRTYIAQESAKWRDVIRSRGIKVQQ